jgi:hypothetical protein
MRNKRGDFMISASVVSTITLTLSGTNPWTVFDAANLATGGNLQCNFNDIASQLNGLYKPLLNSAVNEMNLVEGASGSYYIGHSTSVSLGSSYTSHLSETISLTRELTRDLSVIGVQSVTGLPFTPKTIQIIAGVPAAPGKYCNGFVDQSGTQNVMASTSNSVPDAVGFYPYAIYLIQSTGNATHGTVSITSGGFDITWGHLGSGATDSAVVKCLIVGHY